MRASNVGMLAALSMRPGRTYYNSAVKRSVIISRIIKLIKTLERTSRSGVHNWNTRVLIETG